LTGTLNLKGMTAICHQPVRAAQNLFFKNYFEVVILKINFKK